MAGLWSTLLRVHAGRPGCRSSRDAVGAVAAGRGAVPHRHPGVLGSDGDKSFTSEGDVTDETGIEHTLFIQVGARKVSNPLFL